MEEDKVEVILRFPHPRDREPEDYLYVISKILEICPEFGKCELNRICDGCGHALHFRQTGLNFKCGKCNLDYDLCKKCQETLDLALCPIGWGCNSLT